MSEKRERGHYALVPAREAGWMVMRFEYGEAIRQDDILFAGGLDDCLQFILDLEQPHEFDVLGVAIPDHRVNQGCDPIVGANVGDDRVRRFRERLDSLEKERGGR